MKKSSVELSIVMDMPLSLAVGDRIKGNGILRDTLDTALVEMH